MKQLQNTIHPEQPRPMFENHEQDQKDENVSQQMHQQQQGSSQHSDPMQEQEVQEGEDIEEYQKRLTNRGVVYLSRIPPYMKPNYIRRLLESYRPQRIYLLPQSEWARRQRIKRGGNKRICFRQGWVEFTDKRMAKLAALTLNGQKMVGKKGSFYGQDLWNLKYLPKFKWHHLTERLAHEERIKKERLKVELQQEQKVQAFYERNMADSKKLNGIIRRKKDKGKFEQKKDSRKYQQYGLVPQIKDE